MTDDGFYAAVYDELIAHVTRNNYIHEVGGSWHRWKPPHPAATDIILTIYCDVQRGKVELLTPGLPGTSRNYIQCLKRVKDSALLTHDVIGEMTAAEVLEHLKRIGCQLRLWCDDREGFITALCNLAVRRNYPEFRASFTDRSANAAKYQ